MALFSMTGYGSGGDRGNGYMAEIKSVNHKFLEIRIHLSSDLLPVEPMLLDYLRKRLHRGSVDVTVYKGVQAQSLRKPRLNLEMARAYARIADQAASETGAGGRLGLDTLLMMKDVVEFESAQEETEEVLARILAALDAAVTRWEEMRRREGEALEKVMSEQLAAVAASVADIEALAPDVVAVLREKMRARIAQVRPEKELDAHRLEQEVAYLADRCDITEELVRLKSHISQFGSLFSAPSSCGRKMDFMLQEMNREINTIGSKAQSLPISRLVIDIKAELDRMREQVQNVE
jgi:uncharacterized protein (TIGR00255 family)